MQGGDEEEDVQGNDQMQQEEHNDGVSNGAPTGGEDMQFQDQMQQQEEVDEIFGELSGEAVC